MYAYFKSLKNEKYISETSLHIRGTMKITRREAIMLSLVALEALLICIIIYVALM